MKRILIVMCSMLTLIACLFYISFVLYNKMYSERLILDRSKLKNINICKNHFEFSKKSTVRILIIDGGGIYGIMPLMVLRYLERQSGRPTASLFDYFAGSSTGAIIISAINIPGKDNKPAFTADQLIDIYAGISKRVLTPTIYRRIFTLNGLLGPKLSIQSLHDNLDKLIGSDMYFNRLINGLTITAYALDRAKLMVFNSWDCSKPEATYPVADLLAASTATPTFFSPVNEINTRYHTNNTYIDGAIFANNPSSYAILEAFKLYPNAKKYIFVHLGVGGILMEQYKLTGQKTQSWGVLQWALPINSILFAAQNTAVLETIRGMKEIVPRNRFEYLYFNRAFMGKGAFNASSSNISIIKKNANLLIEESRKRLNDLAKVLSTSSSSN